MQLGMRKYLIPICTHTLNETPSLCRRVANFLDIDQPPSVTLILFTYSTLGVIPLVNDPKLEMCLLIIPSN